MNHFKWSSFIAISILTLVSLLNGTWAKSQNNPTKEYHQRQFDNNHLNELRAESVYDYSIERAEGTTIWQRIGDFIKYLLNMLFNSRGGSLAVRIILYILIIGAAIFSILKLINANPSTIFNKPKNPSLPYKVAEENIHEINFDDEIETAITNHDYRLATRLFYLRALKLLTDRELIHWETGKTNTDYYYELNVNALRSSFSSLGHIFEYAWYGGFSIDKPVMARARKLYEEINVRTQTSGDE